MREVWYENGKRRTTPEYRAWSSMKNRCYNRKSRDFPYYGGRGISVCERWRDSVGAFIADMGRKPSQDHTLDRINVDGDYEPSNCRWATRETQARNRPYARTKAWLLAERLGIKKSTANHIIWQVRKKDRGDTKWFAMSPELEQKVRNFFTEVANGADCSNS